LVELEAEEVGLAVVGVWIGVAVEVEVAKVVERRVLDAVKDESTDLVQYQSPALHVGQQSTFFTGLGSPG
jgi:hypothetical protein